MTFEKNGHFFAKNWEKSLIVIITSTPVSVSFISQLRMLNQRWFETIIFLPVSGICSTEKSEKYLRPNIVNFYQMHWYTRNLRVVSWISGSVA
jgi:hypothetical protein